MKRLTKTYSDGSYGAADDLPCGENSHDFKKLLIDRLGFFEDPPIPGEQKQTAWGDPITPYPKQEGCIVYDIKTLEYASQKDTATLEWVEMQAMIRLQLETYKNILELKERMFDHRHHLCEVNGEQVAADVITE